jgi:hypothetical protein
VDNRSEAVDGTTPFGRVVLTIQPSIPRTSLTRYPVPHRAAVCTSPPVLTAITFLRVIRLTVRYGRHERRQEDCEGLQGDQAGRQDSRGAQSWGEHKRATVARRRENSTSPQLTAHARLARVHAPVPISIP